MTTLTNSGTVEIAGELQTQNTTLSDGASLEGKNADGAFTYVVTAASAGESARISQSVLSGTRIEVGRIEGALIKLS